MRALLMSEVQTIFRIRKSVVSIGFIRGNLVAGSLDKSAESNQYGVEFGPVYLGRRDFQKVMLRPPSKPY